MDDLVIEVVAAAPLSEATRKAIAARVKETTKLGAQVVQLTPGSIPEGAPVIDDRRNLGLDVDGTPLIPLSAPRSPSR